MAILQVTSPDGKNYQVENQDPQKAQQAAMDLANSFGPATSATGALGRGAMDAIPFGTKGVAKGEEALGQGSYQSKLAELDQLLAADRQQHPIAHGTGEVAGTVAPFAIPGVGEALGADTMAGRAAVGAGMGAAQAASQNRNQNTLPSDMMKSAAMGAVTGPAMGALGDKAASLLGSGAEGAQNFSNTSAVQSGGFPSKMLGRLSEDENNALGQWMNDNNLVNGTLPERLQKGELLKQVYGNKIGEMGSNAATLNDPTPYIQDLRNTSDQYSGSANTEAKNLGNTYLTGAQDIENNLPQGSSYQDIQKVKDMYGDLAFDNAHVVKDQAAADTYSALKQMQADLVNASPSEFQDAMKGYSNSSDFVSGLRRQLGVSRGGSQGGGMGVGSLIRQIPGAKNPAIGLPAGLGLMGMGKTFTGAMVAGQALNNPAFKAQAGQVVSGALQKGANAVSGMAPIATNAVTNAVSGPNFNAPEMTPYKPMFQAATKGLSDPAEIQKQNSITDFVLSQRDPNYSAAKQKAAEQLVGE